MKLQDLINNNLPLNRKERFYTGTVFPFIVCKENFKYLNLLFSLLGDIKVPAITSTNDFTNIEFFTEYSLRESVHGTGRYFKELPKTKDTPDIVILIDGTPKVVIAFEAKMFDVPSKEELIKQLGAQKEILNSIKMNLAIDSVYHYALLPQELAIRIGEIGFPILTWESVLDSFRPVCGSDYFYKLLSIALDNYQNLVSTEVTFGKNNEGYMAGLSIYIRFKDGSLNKTWMGRAGGLHGPKLQQDLKVGNWKTQKYETRETPPTGSGINWFRVNDFIALIDSTNNKII